MLVSPTATWNCNEEDTGHYGLVKHWQKPFKGCCHVLLHVWRLDLLRRNSLLSSWPGPQGCQSGPVYWSCLFTVRNFVGVHLFRLLLEELVPLLAPLVIHHQLLGHSQCWAGGDRIHTTLRSSPTGLFTPPPIIPSKFFLHTFCMYLNFYGKTQNMYIIYDFRYWNLLYSL